MRLLRPGGQADAAARKSDDEQKDALQDDKQGLYRMIVAGAEQCSKRTQSQNDNRNTGKNYMSMRSSTKVKSRQQMDGRGGRDVRDRQKKYQAITNSVHSPRHTKGAQDGHTSASGRRRADGMVRGASSEFAEPDQRMSRRLNLRRLRLDRARHPDHEEEETAHRARTQRTNAVSQPTNKEVIPAKAEATAKAPAPRPPFRIGSFWHKLRELSAQPAAEEAQQPEVDQAKLDMDERELERDIESAKSQADGGAVPEGRRSTSFPAQNRDLRTDAITAFAPSVFSPPVVGAAPVEIVSSTDNGVPAEPGASTANSTSLAMKSSSRAPSNTPGSRSQPPSGRGNGRRAIDLLSELFPEAIRSSPTDTLSTKTPETDLKAPREVARLPFSSSIASLLEAVTSHEAEITAAVASRAVEKEQLKARERWRRLINESIAVLVLRKASMHLAVSDFTSISPSFSAQHLSGWNSKNDIIRVIRARNTETYEALPTYFLVFGSEEAAKAYRDHAFALHNYARTFSPVTGFGSPRLSGPERYKIPDPSAVSRYTLALPGHDLDLRLVRQPFASLMRKVLETEGYVGLQDRAQSEWEVLLTVDSASWPTATDFHVKDGRGVLALRKALINDSRDRGTMWDIVSARHAVRELDISDRKAEPEKSDGSEQAKSSFAVQLQRKFVVSFTSKSEAFRFVSHWHRRDIRHLLDSVSDKTDEVIINAEIVW